jgi:hypothetical protein
MFNHFVRSIKLIGELRIGAIHQGWLSIRLELEEHMISNLELSINKGELLDHISVQIPGIDQVLKVLLVAGSLGAAAMLGS